MAEETQNLVQEPGAEESVIHVEHREQRRIMSCNKGTMMSALSVFVALLICGQAVTVYFLTQHQSKIQDLDFNNKQMKLQDMISKLPGSPQSHSQSQHKKIRMANFNIPLAFKDTDGSSDPMQSISDLKKIAETTNKMGDAAKYMLLMGNPLRTYPSFNGTILENLKLLKKSLSDQEWMVFDAWMQQWFLFYLVQNSNQPDSTRFQATAASVLTDCQLKASSAHTKLGTYAPECDEIGDFMPKQCWRSTGYCWCVYKNGTEIPETRTRKPLNCTDFLEPEDYMASASPVEHEFMPYD